MADYYNVTTNTGDAEIAAAIASNTKLAITHIAFGDGNGAVPTPNKARTSLVREVHRQPVTKYERHPTNSNWIEIETVIPSNIGGFWVREMGVIANGKLISHGSHAPFEKVADPTGVSEYRLKFTQNIKDGNVVSITLDQSLIYATQAWVDENYIPRSAIVDDTKTDDSKKPLSAKQGKKLQDEKLDIGQYGFGGSGASYTPTSNRDFINYMAGKSQIARRNDGVSDVPNYSAGIYAQTDDTYMHISAGYTGTGINILAGRISDSNVVVYKLLTNQDNAASASKLQTARNIAISGDGTGNASFDGSANAGINFTLKDVNNSAGTYGANNLEIPTFTLNKKGLLTSAGNRQFPLATTTQYGATLLYPGTDSYSNEMAATANVARYLESVKLNRGELGFGGSGASYTPTSNRDFINYMAGKSQIARRNDGVADVPNYSAGIYAQTDDTYMYISAGYTGTGINVLAGRISDSNVVVYKLLTNQDNAASASKLQTARNIAISGDVSGSADFDGSRNIQINTSINGFDNLKSPNGYTKLPNGLILQWGTQDYASNPGEVSASITFPIAFPNSCLNISLTRKISAQSPDGDGTALLISTTQTMAHISLQHMNSASTSGLRGYTWLAIGY